MQRSARARETSRAEQASEWRKRMNEQTSKWPSNYVPILCCSEPQCIGSWEIKGTITSSSASELVMHYGSEQSDVLASSHSVSHNLGSE